LRVDGSEGVLVFGKREAGEGVDVVELGEKGVR